MFAGAEDDSIALISAPVLETVCPLGSVISDDDAEGAFPSCPVLLLVVVVFSGPLLVDVDVVVVMINCRSVVNFFNEGFSFFSFLTQVSTGNE